MKKGKKLARLLSIIMAVAMLLSLMAVNVSAETYTTTGLDDTKTVGTLTLKQGEAGVKANSVYSAYKILDATLPGSDNEQDVYDYSWTANFASFADKAVTKYGLTLKEIDALGNGNMDYTIGNANTADKLGAALEKFVADNNKILADKTGIKVEEAVDLPIGYYLILETTTTPGYKTTKPIIVGIPKRDTDDAKYLYDVTINLKDQPIEITKSIEESKQAAQDSIASQVGTEKNFKIEQDVPVYDDTYNKIQFSITDTMAKGISPVIKDTGAEGETAAKYGIVVSGVNKNGDKTPLKPEQFVFSADTNDDGQTVWKFDFSDRTANGEGMDYYNYVKGYEKIEITYPGVINKDANFGPSGVMNEVIPTFGPNPDSTTSGEKDKAKMYAGGLALTKKDDKGNLLTGAEFAVYTPDDKGEFTQDDKYLAPMVTYKVDSDGNITTTVKDELSAKATVDENGVVRFDGLGATTKNDNGTYTSTYYIKETKAPSGYVLPKTPIKVEVTVELPDKISSGNEEATFTYEVSGGGVDETQVTTEDGIVSFNVVNTKGFTLPTTGGMGTYLFTIGGVAIMLIAAGIFVASRKKNAQK